MEPEPRPHGHWDSTEARDPGEDRVDLGGLFVPNADGMGLSLEVMDDEAVARP